MQARDVMTREVVTVGPDTSAKYAAEVMAERGYAALPVVDDERLIGIVNEADVLRHRIPADPRLHLRREDDDRSDDGAAPLGLLVRDVMTTGVRTVPATADVADLARLFVDDHLRSAPVLDGEALAGMISRRDLLRMLVRPDEDIAADVLALVEAYTGESGSWQVVVTEGVATVRRTAGAPQVSQSVEQHALRRLVTTVSGVVGVHVPVAAPAPRVPARQ